MRRSVIAAGLSLVALLPLAAGARFLDVRTEDWSLPPLIATNPDGARLAAAIKPDDLNDVLISRLVAFNAQPLRGRYDKAGLDRMKAWAWTYLGRAAVRTYHLTRDPRLIELVLSGFDKYAAEGQAQATQPGGFGWYTHDLQRDVYFKEIPITGLVIAPIVEMLQLAETDDRLAAIIRQRRQDLMQVIRRGIDGFSTNYDEQAGLGFYRNPADPDVLPLNLSSVYARPLLGLGQLTSNQEYFREAAGIARTWQAMLTARSPDDSFWTYTPQPGNPKNPMGPRERMIKAGAGVEFPLAAYHAGIVLSAADIGLIAAMPHTILLERPDSAHVSLRRYVDAKSRDFFTMDRADIRDLMALSSWYAFVCHDPDLEPMLDPILFGLDAKFYLHDGRAMMAIAGRLALPPGPQRCSSSTPPVPHTGAN